MKYFKLLLLVILCLQVYVNCGRKKSTMRQDDGAQAGTSNPTGKSLSWDRLRNVNIVHAPENPITTNYHEMLTDHSKIAIQMGIPEHIDFEHNLEMPGDVYEDPVFVNENGQEITSNEAVAEQQEEINANEETNEQADVQNEEILAEIENAKVNTPDEAHELILSKHAEIMKFLEDIAKLKWLNNNEKRVVSEVTRYIQLLKNRHDLIKNTHEEEILQDLEVKIHQITIALDEHTFNAHAMKNRAESIYHHMKENKLYARRLVGTIEQAVNTMARGPQMEGDSVIAVGKVEADAEKFVKIQQIRLTQDLCELEIPLRNRAEMTRLVETYKDQQIAETKRVNEMIDNFEALIKNCNICIQLVAGEKNDEAYDLMKNMIEAQDTPQNVIVSLEAARTALDQEDLNVFDTKINLSLERSKFWMDKSVAVAGSLIYQTQLIRKAETSIKDGDRWMTTGYEEFNKIEDEVMRRQPFVKFTPALHEKSLDIYHELKTGSIKIATEKTKQMEVWSQVHGYQDLIGAKLPLAKSLEDVQEDQDNAEAHKVEREIKAVRGDFAAGNIYEANVVIDTLGDIIQRRVKISHVQRATEQVNQNNEKDAVAMKESVQQIKTIIDHELSNLAKFNEDQTKLLADTEHARVNAISHPDFKEAVSSVEGLTENPSATGLEQLSFMYALKYAKQDDRNDTMKFLFRAQDQMNDELRLLANTKTSLEVQLHLLNGAIESAMQADRKQTVLALERVAAEIEEHQDYIRADTDIEEQIEQIKNHSIEGRSTEAADQIYELARKHVYIQEHSVAEKKVKQDAQSVRHNIELTQEPVIPVRNPNEAEQNAEVIEKDGQSAVEAIHEVATGEESKESAGIEVEVVESQIQKFEKLDDLKTTQAKCREAHNVKDIDAQVEAITDQEASVSEEEVFLKKEKESVNEVREKIIEVIDDCGNEKLNNSDISKTVDTIISHKTADSGTNAYLRSAQAALSTNDRSKSKTHLFEAKEHLERSLTDLTNSLKSLSQQLDYLSEAKRAAQDGEFEKVEQALEYCYENAENSQTIYFTDKEVNDNKDTIIKDIGEARVEQAAALMEEMTARSEQNIREPLTLELLPGEIEGRAEANKNLQGEKAFKAINEDNNKAAAIKAIDDAHDTAQHQEKVHKIESVEQELLANEEVDPSLIESLKEEISDEKKELEDDNDTLGHDKMKLEKASHDPNPDEETKKELESELEEGVVDAEVQVSIQEAINDIENGDGAKADQDLKQAVDETEEQIRENSQSIKSVEKQEKKLEEAAEALKDGDVEKATDLVRDVQEETDEQPIVRTNPELEELHDQAQDEVQKDDHADAHDTVSQIVGHDIEPPTFDYFAEAEELEDQIRIKNWPVCEEIVAKFQGHEKEDIVEQASVLKDVILQKDSQNAHTLVKRLQDMLHEASVDHEAPHKKQKDVAVVNQSKRKNMRFQQKHVQKDDGVHRIKADIIKPQNTLRMVQINKAPAVYKSHFRKQRVLKH